MIYAPDLTNHLANAIAQGARCDALKEMQKVSENAASSLRRSMSIDPNSPTLPSDLKHAFGQAVTALGELAILIEEQLEEENR